ncbi:MAG: transketolase [Clostridia bacterium]|nr:transketolase [Clostridia bacterium]
MEKKVTSSEELAFKIRKDITEMSNIANSSHIASALSVTDIVAVLYSQIAQYDINNPQDENRDRIILSKGHAGSAIYAALAEEGFFNKDELYTYCQNGSILSGHVSQKNVPGVEFSTGSLGHGMPVGAGIALSAKIDHKKFNTYVIIGDGECDEGTIWECALFSRQYKLDNLIVIVDSNKMQAMGNCDDIISLNPFNEKWKSFGWNVYEIDGNNHEELRNTFLKIEKNGKPNVIIANTIKGKGISFMENNLVWHYKSPQGDDFKNAIEELEAKQ